MLVLLEIVVPRVIMSLCYLYWNIDGQAHHFYTKLLIGAYHISGA